MTPLNRAQREALKAVYHRTTLWQLDGGERMHPLGFKWPEYTYALKVTYRKFRQTVRPGPDCIMVPWCDMWLGIEPDGYTHS